MLYVLPYGQMSLWGIFCPKCLAYAVGILWFFDFIAIYLAPDRVAKRIRSTSRVGPHNNDIISIFTGSLLGDGHAELRPDGRGTRLGFYQEASHQEYLLWFHNLVASLGYCNPTQPLIQTRLGSGGVIRSILRFHTYTYSSLNFLYYEWYVKGVKVVPANISDYITPLALAIWIMDNGGRVGYGLKLATNSFSYGDCTRLSLIIYEKYGIKSSVQSAGVPNQYIIYIWSESMPILREIVRPYIVSSMLYKLGI